MIVRVTLSRLAPERSIYTALNVALLKTERDPETAALLREMRA
jgi:hypothetical protein